MRHFLDFYGLLLNKYLRCGRLTFGRLGVGRRVTLLHVVGYERLIYFPYIYVPHIRDIIGHHEVRQQKHR